MSNNLWNILGPTCWEERPTLSPSFALERNLPYLYLEVNSRAICVVSRKGLHNPLKIMTTSVLNRMHALIDDKHEHLATVSQSQKSNGIVCFGLSNYCLFRKYFPKCFRIIEESEAEPEMEQPVPLSGKEPQRLRKNV